MDFQLTAEQRRLQHKCRELAADFATRSAAHERDASHGRELRPSARRRVPRADGRQGVGPPKSSVIPSAKYSWSGSFDRFAKGRTTIDSRGAGVLATAGGICRLAAAGAWTDNAGEFPLGQAHQATIAKPIAARRLAAITAR